MTGLRTSASRPSQGGAAPVGTTALGAPAVDADRAVSGLDAARVSWSVDGRLVWSVLRNADYEATGAIRPHSEGIIDLLAQAEDAEVAILFKEAETDGATRVSVRTRPGGVDATVLTGRFGGGGHARAAGASLAQPVDEAVLARYRVEGATPLVWEEGGHRRIAAFRRDLLAPGIKLRHDADRTARALIEVWSALWPAGTAEIRR